MMFSGNFLRQCLIPGHTLGIVGAGRTGTALCKAAEKAGIRVLVSDPPLSEAEAEALNGELRQLWGNGMGGCTALPDPDENSLVFLPADMICRQADIIVLLVPLTEAGVHPTKGMIGKAFLGKCRPDVRILCASDPGVIADDVKDDPRILILPEHDA